ncbi:polysaccharide deacetylase family protein [Thalassomonas viridans]|uniref:Polysaccharide deacetylase family protein n=1 Tax=Thalassomonas viridans TaxID=137584 RepID=A0AAF0C9L4_9GAMM|nr:polysaccharide deacetylase family protein [Thalassomonas viridans]WDE05596.1 polysaccharide deacetylase family protein [Thalassomonas viridans]
MKLLLLILLCSIYPTKALSAVILQYHHVNDNTPASTSISPDQFKKHLEYLKAQQFKVVPLSDVMNSIKKQQPIADKTVVITFDDAYLDIFTQARPLLEQYDYPYTVFINPAQIDKGHSNYLSWQQIKTMADSGVIIANHGLEHDSAARKADKVSDEQWLLSYSYNIIEAEQIIKEKTGQNWQYFSYPYGEYSPAIQQWLRDNDYIGFSQQSGAVGLATDLTSVPRFPASRPYDKLSSLRDKLYSLPFSISLPDNRRNTIVNNQQTPDLDFKVIVHDFHPEKLSCYVSGLGRQQVIWQNESRFTIELEKALSPGRQRTNCTAPSISKPGRFYWYSRPWFILDKDNRWYPL